MTTLDLVSNPEQSKLLEGIMEQLQEAVPQVIDLANELTAKNSLLQAWFVIPFLPAFNFSILGLDFYLQDSRKQTAE